MRYDFHLDTITKLTDHMISIKDIFQSMYVTSTDGMIIMKNHKFVDFNPALVDMFGFGSRDELINTHIANLMPKYQPDGILSLKKMMKMAAITLNKGHSAFEFQFQKKDKTLFWCDIVLTKINTDSTDLIYGVYRDITAKKELEIIKENFQNKLRAQVAQEVEKNRQKDHIMMQQSRLAQMGEMINMIAHQWRQPLTAISSTNSAISLKLKLGKLDLETGKKLTDNIDQYVKHLSATIDDFRTFFKQNKKKEATTLNIIIEKTLNIVNISLANANINLTTELLSDETIYTYTNELKQVVLNLIKNAEDALLHNDIENPHIHIKTYKNIISVSDNAGGIPTEIVDKIFEPYFSTKIEKDGTGLGLYMSKTIIEDHCKGKLEVTNTDEGALFTITL